LSPVRSADPGLPNVERADPRQRSRQLLPRLESRPKTKARNHEVPGFDLSAFARVFGVYPNSWTVTAGTSGVLIQQHAHGQQVWVNTEAKFYPSLGRFTKLPG